MEHVAIEEHEPADRGEQADRLALSELLGTTDVAINRYRLSPGERISGLHGHEDQEELFLVLDGRTTFETLDGEHAIDAGEIVRFAPGEFQSGKSETTATVLALGAPRDSDEVRVPVQCEACGYDRTEPTVEGGESALVCPECGHESAVECPACGGQNVRAELSRSDHSPVSVCFDCGAEWDAR